MKAVDIVRLCGGLVKLMVLVKLVGVRVLVLVVVYVTDNQWFCVVLVLVIMCGACTGANGCVQWWSKRGEDDSVGAAFDDGDGGAAASGTGDGAVCGRAGADGAGTAVYVSGASGADEEKEKNVDVVYKDFANACHKCDHVVIAHKTDKSVIITRKL